MYTEKEIVENEENDNGDSKVDTSYKNISDLNNPSNINCFYVLISFLINFSLIIVAIWEFIIKKYCTIFNYLVDIFILFVFIFVIIYLFTKKDDFLKGFVYYPLISLFWGIADFLSLFVTDNYNNWSGLHTLKTIKFSLITISIFINIIYIKCIHK